MTQIYCSILLIVLSIACLTNYAHADDYREEWKRTLIALAAFAVICIPKVAAMPVVPFEVLGFVFLVTLQNVSMSLHSYQRHKERQKIIGGKLINLHNPTDELSLRRKTN